MCSVELIFFASFEPKRFAQRSPLTEEQMQSTEGGGREGEVSAATLFARLTAEAAAAPPSPHSLCSW